VAARAFTAGVSLALLCACFLREEELPKVHAQPTAEPCWMPAPPPALTIAVGADPAHCLPEPVRARGLDVLVRLSPDGRPTAVEDVLDLCLIIGPNGKEIPKHQLSVGEKQCIVESLHGLAPRSPHYLRPALRRHLAGRSMLRGGSACRTMSERSNKRMQLTKLRAAPERRAEVPPCAPPARWTGHRFAADPQCSTDHSRCSRNSRSGRVTV